MTLSEALTVMKIMATADGWCSCCGMALIEDFGKAFPKFSDVLLTEADIEKLKEAYSKKEDENIENDILETNVWELS